MSGLRLINCQDHGLPNEDCPENDQPGIDPAPGREPALTPLLPEPDPPLSGPDAFYRDPNNFPELGLTDCSPTDPGDYVFDESGSSDPNIIQLADNCFYMIDGEADLENIAGYSNVVIFATGELELTGTTTLTSSILISVGELRLKGGLTIVAPLPYPAIVSETEVSSSDPNVEIFGTVYSGGLVDLNPINVHGVIIGDVVELQGTSTDITDDHATDTDFLKYYAIMPGFEYPDELLTTVGIAGTWRELL